MFLFFYLGFTVCTNYFTHFEPCQSEGKAKTGDPWETPPDHPQADHGLSYMWPERGSNPQWWNDERFRALKISGLNHSATGVTPKDSDAKQDWWFKRKKSASFNIPPTYPRGGRARRRWYHGPSDYIAKLHCPLTFDRPLWFGDGTLYFQERVPFRFLQFLIISTIYFSWLRPELVCLLLGPPGFNCWFSFAPVFQWCCSTLRGSPGVGRNKLFLSSPHLCFIIVFICDLFFPVMIHWWVRKHSGGPNNCMFWAMTEAKGEVGIP